MNTYNYKNEIVLAILRVISKKEKISQRFLSKEIGCSLGKLNLMIKEIQKQKLINVKVSKDEKKKLQFSYFLTEKGKKYKNEQMIDLMKKKLNEYNELKSEIDFSKSKSIDYDLL
tara:strand:- start:100 stop:444 length:345 start_codon:yes stop_codon:yes gene_type:complete